MSQQPPAGTSVRVTIGATTGAVKLLRVAKRAVLVLLAPDDGADFNLFLRDSEAVRTLLREAVDPRSAERAEHPPDATEYREPPSDATHYSGRAWLLVPRLRAQDLRLDHRKAPRLGPRLAGSHGGTSVDRLCRAVTANLPQGCTPAAATAGELAAAINELLAAPPATLARLRVDDKDAADIVGAVGNSVAAARLRAYFAVCTAFSKELVPLGKRLRVGRVLAALSYETRMWSVSFRTQSSEAGYEASTHADGGNLNTIAELCRALFAETFTVVSTSARPSAPRRVRGRAASLLQAEQLAELGGLVVVTGATNSAKSLVTRGLIHLYLQKIALARGKRLPHLVTFEDPIERYYADDTHEPADGHAQLAVMMSAAQQGIDYTPRQIRIDAPNLKQALHDALRQTPKVFFVGETRQDRDWRTLLDFAATGHLVVTTAHAGSLIEAVRRIFLALGARTPADRNQIATRLIAVIHLKRATVAGHAAGVLLPAIWRRVPKGVTALTAEGLAAVLPHGRGADDDLCSCLGRKYFASRLLEEAAARKPAPDFARRLIEQATEWDLKGA